MENNNINNSTTEEENNLTFEDTISVKSLDNKDQIDEYQETENFEPNLEDLSKGLDNEEKRLLNLENQRIKLAKEIELLQKNVNDEKILYRKAIDNLITFKQKTIITSNPENEGTQINSQFNPLTIDTEKIAEKVKKCQAIIEESRTKVSRGESDLEIDRLKQNLITYRKALKNTGKEKISKEKQKAAAKILQKHLEKVDSKCNEQMIALEEIHKSLENLTCSKNSK